MNENYLPLYRKYRPQSLEELVGQEHIKNALKNAIELNKIAHAYLFTGPRGTGKTSTARIFAKSLNCKNGPTITPCGKCESCMDITNAIPMDVIEIDAASNRKVEDAQNILEKILYAPVYGKYKIYIIDEVHMLSNTAFNSLLKTLEEPPENVIFILATTEVHKVLDTIKSRCQRFDFRRITTDDIVKHLQYISEKEKINISEDALYTIAKNSAGGMRDSIALLDQVSVLGGNKQITSEDINNLLGRISFDTLEKLTDTIISSQPQQAIELLESIYNNGNEPVQILSNLLDYLKNLLIAKNCRDEIIIELTQLNDSQIKSIKKQSEKVETHQIISLIDKCTNYIKEIKLTNNPRLWMDVSLIDLANLTENTKLEELQKRITEIESSGQHHQTGAYKTPPSPVAKPETIRPNIKKTEPEIKKPTEAVVSKAINDAEKISNDENTDTFSPMPKAKSKVEETNDIAQLWIKLLDNITSPPTKSLLKQWANPICISAENTTLSINSENLLKQFLEGNKRTILIKAIDTLFGQENSNVIIRLPQPNDIKLDNIKPTVQKPKPVIPDHTPQKVEEEPTEEELQEVKQEVKEEVKSFSTNKTMYSDMTNMVVDLFDGKVIE